MIRAELIQQLQDVGVDPSLPDPLGRLQAAAHAAPADASLRAAVFTAHAWRTADAGLEPTVAGVARERLVRWDAHTTTWFGPSVDGSGTALVRVLRPPAARDPVLHRALERDARALKRVLPELRFVESAAAMVCPLPGPGFLVSDVPSGHVQATTLTALLARSVLQLAERSHAGLGFAAPAPEELVDTTDAIRWICLTPFAGDDPAAVLRLVAEGLGRWWSYEAEHPVADLLEALHQATPRSLDEVADVVGHTLASVLASTRHAVVARHRTADSRDRHGRLLGVTSRLTAACPAPEGRGAVGVDLEGRTLVVVSDGAGVRWGPAGRTPSTVLGDDGSLRVAAARRLVLARATAPVSPRLNQEVDGDPAFAEAIARWTSAALELRLLRLLLEAR